MFRNRSLFIAAALLMLALLPVAGAVSVPSNPDVQLRRAFAQPLAAVTATFRPSYRETLTDIGTITVVGAGLLGLAAVVRKSTRT
jgi:hypothetical protein